MHKIIGLIILMFSTLAQATEVKITSVSLLQPEKIIAERVDVSALAGFIQSVGTSLQAQWQSVSMPPGAGFIVLAVRPGGQVNVWIDFEPSLPEAVKQETIAHIRAMSGVPVHRGTVVFALALSVNGAAVDQSRMPNPVEWREAVRDSSRPVEIETLVNQLWP